jgi:hypothetical protein
MDSGPELEWLTRRLGECPEDFLLPVGRGAGHVEIEAVVADLLRDLGNPAPAEEAAAIFTSRRIDAAWQRLVLLVCWLLHDEWFVRQRCFAAPARAFLNEGLSDLATLVKPELFLRDADRREELVRLTLRALRLVPAGEREAVALDRLTTLSSVERKRVLDATKAAHEHAERVRRAMAEKAAAESAARYGRE